MAIIDIVAPANGCSPADLQAILQTVSGWGHTPRIATGIIAGDQGHSQTASFRANDMKTALEAADSAAVWVLRGGEGCNEVLPELLDVTPPAAGKMVIGMSDATNVLNVLKDKGFACVHGITAHQMLRGQTLPEAHQKMQALLGHRASNEEASPTVIQQLHPLNDAAKASGTIEASGGGGNITLLRSALGTGYSFNAKNKIVLLEDVGETPESLEKMLAQLQEAGALAGAKAIVFGAFDSAAKRLDSATHAAIEQKLEAFARTLDIPVLSRAENIGHCTMSVPVVFDNMRLTYGAVSRLEASLQHTAAAVDEPLHVSGMALLRDGDALIAFADLAVLEAVVKKTSFAEPKFSTLFTPKGPLWKQMPLVDVDVTALMNSLGTDAAPDFSGKIVRLQDAEGMREWRLNRVLTQLSHSGVLDNAQAVILGDFSKTVETVAGSGLKEQVLENFKANQQPCVTADDYQKLISSEGQTLY